ncbi:MAG: tRNA preQ1(34) S-adenosylmethionine ribosyltransferase-isomerase QueA [Betaproteobacteria bacterium]|nr:tRNA preQ1(34) S-adenosylmethionine ribosyltransferase-isomerase QueA [Betaproteobacteria bacterium]
MPLLPSPFPEEGGGSVSNYNRRVKLSDFDYELPPELIAQHPAPERASSRLLRVEPAGELRDLAFRDLPSLLDARDLLVFNDTRVIKARLRGRKDTGGEVEALVERVLGEDTALVHVRASKTPKPGRRLVFAPGVTAEVIGRRGELFELRFEAGWPVLDVLATHGEVPLPPYITHAPQADDESRYQTVYATVPGAVAAPTAGLHFDEAVLGALKAKGLDSARVTLHVGAGTFQPVRGDDIASHVMHGEWYSIPEATVGAIAAAKARGGRVVAVGTTTLRALESGAAAGTLHAQAAETRLFIVPGFRFRVVDRLVTNFHLPRSTLLMLVSAFSGTDRVRRAYAHAIAQRYRFFSYGDAMLLDRNRDD